MCCCWHFGDVCSDLLLPTPFRLFLLVAHCPFLKSCTSSYIFGVTSFLWGLSSEPAYADLWGSKRLVGQNSLQWYVFTIVIVLLSWPVNTMIITYYAPQENLSCSLESCFGWDLLLPPSVRCFPVKSLCDSHALLPHHMEQLPGEAPKTLVLPFFTRSFLWHCHCLGLNIHHLSLVSATCRTWIWLISAHSAWLLGDWARSQYHRII